MLETLAHPFRAANAVTVLQGRRTCINSCWPSAHQDPDMTTAIPQSTGRVVTPGDVVLKLPETGQVTISGGLQQAGDHINSTKAGVLRQTKAGKLWVEGRQKRYIPSQEDAVIGIITEKYGENFNVDIGAAFPAALPVLAFEGATRRNRPNLAVGDLVYARVTTAHRDLEPTIACTDANGKASGFGALKEGHMISCTSSLARKLLSKPPCAVLAALGKKLQFEVAVGINGRVWVNSPNVVTTISIANAIANSEFLSDAQAVLMVERVLSQVQ